MRIDLVICCKIEHDDLMCIPEVAEHQTPTMWCSDSKLLCFGFSVENFLLLSLVCSQVHTEKMESRLQWWRSKERTSKFFEDLPKFRGQTLRNKPSAKFSQFQFFQKGLTSVSTLMLVCWTLLCDVVLLQFFQFGPAWRVVDSQGPTMLVTSKTEHTFKKIYRWIVNVDDGLHL